MSAPPEKDPGSVPTHGTDPREKPATKPTTCCDASTPPRFGESDSTAEQLDLFGVPKREPYRINFEPKGTTYDATLDRERLETVQGRIEARADGRHRTIAEWIELAGGSPTGVAARLRQARTRGFVVERQRIAGGLWSYAVRPVAK